MKQDSWVGGIFVSVKGVSRKWWPARFQQDAKSRHQDLDQTEVEV